MRGARYWDHLAARDPLWAVLSDPSKTGRRWQLQEFMQNGEREIALLELQLRRLGIGWPDRAALDFGCGVGRLTQALARRCRRVVGVDVSPRMTALARRVNQYPDVVEYVVNDRDDLAIFTTASFDFIYSNIVLQHVPPAEARRYIAEFLRVLCPGGVLVFQLPSHPTPAAAAAIRPMPRSAYDAEIELLAPLPASAPAGTTLRLPLTITNRSGIDWRQPDVGSIRVGNHWFDAPGTRMLIQDDGRSVLPQTVGAGERCFAEIDVTTPSAAGVYVLEIDCVHEGVAWFRQGARSPLTVDPRVEDATRAPAQVLPDELPVPVYADDAMEPLLGAPSEEPLPEFPMHGVERAEVLALIAAHGGELVSLEEDARAGSEWQSFRYFVRRRAIAAATGPTS